MDINKVYIPISGSTVRERNMKLSAVIATAPTVNRRIVKIERDAEGQAGYWFYYVDSMDSI